MAVDSHPAGPADGPATGTPERQGIIDRFPDFNETIQHTIGWFHLQTVFLIIRGGMIVLGIETAYAKGGVHQKDDSLPFLFYLPKALFRESRRARPGLKEGLRVDYIN
jgi:hypothetical protein